MRISDWSSDVCSSDLVGYDRLIEMPGVFYLTFDNKEVGRIQAREVLKVQPEGNYVFIKGSSADPNADFLHEGQLEVLQEAIAAGKIKVVGEQYTDGRSEERRVGKERVSQCRSRWWQYH